MKGMVECIASNDWQNNHENGDNCRRRYGENQHLHGEILSKSMQQLMNVRFNDNTILMGKTSDM